MSGDVFKDGLVLNKTREDMAKIHIESFNAMFNDGDRKGLIDLMLAEISPIEIDHESVPDAPAARGKFSRTNFLHQNFPL